MREYLEVRVDPELFTELFRLDEGELGDAVFVTTLETNDPRMLELGRLKQAFRRRGRSFYYGWRIYRTYSKAELDQAELLHLLISRRFEPAGEECGTEYDDTQTCPHCGFGRKLVPPLRLDLTRVPKTASFAESIACDERVASSAVVSTLAALGARGCDFLPVSHRRSDSEWESRNLQKLETGRRILEAALAAGVPYPTLAFWRWIDRPSQERLRARLGDELTAQYGRRPQPSWFHPVLTSAPLMVGSTTRFGDGPFDHLLGTEVTPCPLGHVGGLNLLSELHIRRESWDGSDICETAVATGLRRGLLRPARLLLVSQAVRQELQRVKARGITFEVARLE